MAIALDATSKNSSSVSGTTISVSHTCSGDNRILCVFIGTELNPNFNAYPKTVTYNSIELIKIGNVTNGGNWTGTWWYLINPSTGSNTITATWASAETKQLILGVSYTGVLQSPIIDSISTAHTSSNEPSSTTITDTITTINNNVLVLSGLVASNSINISVSSPYTLRASDTAQSSFSGYIADHLVSSAGADTVTWNKSDNWQFVGDVMYGFGIQTNNPTNIAWTKG